MKCECGVLHSAFGVTISFSDWVMCVSLACLHTVGAFPVSVSLLHLTGLLIIVKLLPRCKQCNSMFYVFCLLKWIS